MHRFVYVIMPTNWPNVFRLFIFPILINMIFKESLEENCFNLIGLKDDLIRITMNSHNTMLVITLEYIC